MEVFMKQVYNITFIFFTALSVLFVFHAVMPLFGEQHFITQYSVYLAIGSVVVLFVTRFVLITCMKKQIKDAVRSIVKGLELDLKHFISDEPNCYFINSLFQLRSFNRFCEGYPENIILSVRKDVSSLCVTLEHLGDIDENGVCDEYFKPKIIAKVKSFLNIYETY